ncbi:Hypothetical Protein FCC1311_107562 [Hondaea fermentalgiana]|uniref:Uncharacterized protein n=1 Tax=Hondaea fermentalgiana TaxID=2315210 RepID=A0A2R5GUK2_9STRA|nr:Hypothetical Protein FCC1311_107562 [Hondaea fermentalgiana]|eukprot:GBG34532.1 Hypothetical Protein FCC1311_107562 [Hondaea fermentalgiana]
MTWSLQTMESFAKAVQQLRTAAPSGSVEAVEDAEAVLLLHTSKSRKYFIAGKEYTHRGLILKRLHASRAWSAPVPVHVSNAPKRKLGNGKVAVIFLQDCLLESFSKSGRLYIDPAKPGVARGFFDSGAPTTLSGCIVEIDETRSHHNARQSFVIPSTRRRDSLSSTTSTSSAASDAALYREKVQSYMDTEVAWISSLRGELDLLFTSCSMVEP